MAEAVEPEIACPRCGYRDHGRFCSMCGHELVRRAPHHRAARSLLAPILDYYGMAQTAVRPRRLVAEVAADRLGLTDLIGPALGAFALTAAVTALLPGASTIGWTGGKPLVSDLIELALPVGYILLLYLPLHGLLQRPERPVLLRHFVTVTIATYAALVPWTTLLHALLVRAHWSWPAIVALNAPLGWYIASCARLYRRSWLRVLVTIVLLLLAVSAVVTGGALLTGIVIGLVSPELANRF